jgi:phage FluMu gp28-like protein
MDKVGQHVQALNVVAQFSESNFMEGTSVKQLEVRFPNGSVICGLPANPDTARGYSGHITLDEFAFHADADKIYGALYPTITRGYGLEVISTPNGKQGKFYELAKAAGLVDGEDADPACNWSAHTIDIYQAAAQGLADMVPMSDRALDAKWLEMIRLAFLERGINPTARMLRFVAELRSGMDEEAWLQEMCCQFLSTAENFFPPELVQACIKAGASIDAPLELLASEPGEFFLGIDIGRHQDRTVLWLDRASTAVVHDLAGREVLKHISTARRVTTLHRTPFQDQLDVMREVLHCRKSGGEMLVRRACIDATGMGGPLAEALVAEFGGRVEPVVFTAPVKEDLAFRTLRKGQSGEIELPENEAIRRAFGAVKKVVTVGGAIRFDSERTEAGHADEFWAKALCDLAADRPGHHLEEGTIVGVERDVELQYAPLAAAF